MKRFSFQFSTKIRKLTFGVHLIIMTLSLISGLSCSERKLRDNPDIRPYMNLGTPYIDFEELRLQIPADTVVQMKHYHRAQMLKPTARSAFSVTEGVALPFFSVIQILEKGTDWTYSGYFYFDDKKRCVAIEYETTSSSPKPPRSCNHWSPRGYYPLDHKMLKSSPNKTSNID